MLRVHQEENKRAGLQRFLQTLNVNSGPGLKTFEVLCCVVHCFCLVSVAEDRSSIDSGRWRIRWEPYVTFALLNCGMVSVCFCSHLCKGNHIALPKLRCLS